MLLHVDVVQLSQLCVNWQIEETPLHFEPNCLDLESWRALHGRILVLKREQQLCA